MSGPRGTGPVEGIEHAVVAARVGVKGAEAGAALAALGLALPARPNAWCPLALSGDTRRGRVLRLGAGEYLVEQDGGDDLVTAITAGLVVAGRQAWAVERADTSLLVAADVGLRCLPQMSRYDTALLAQDPESLALTMVAGITVTLLREPASGALRLWCDAGYRDYLLDCFRALTTTEVHSPQAPRGAP